MARGLDRERRVANLLEKEGWLVGSRRHIGGAGDLLAVDLMGGRLIEVKSTLTPYSHFGPEARKAMRETAVRFGVTAWLAWWPKNGKLKWIPQGEWP